MKVTYVWPNYDGVIHGVRIEAPTDAFWIECSSDEAQKLLSFAVPVSEMDQKRIEDWRARGFSNYCFLVTRDLRIVIPFWWSYPFDNLWNAYSPFQRVEPIEIDDLQQLRNLNSIRR